MKTKIQDKLKISDLSIHDPPKELSFSSLRDIQAEIQIPEISNRLSPFYTITYVKWHT